MQPYSDQYNIDLDGRSEGMPNRRILIATPSISILGRKEWRTAVFRLEHRQSQPSGREKTNSRNLNKQHQSRRSGEGKANSRIPFEKTSISAFGRRERRTAVFSLNHYKPRRSGKGKTSSHIPIKPTSISAVGRRE